MEMTCWSVPEISFIAQCFFIGSSLGILFVSLPQKLGRLQTFKVFVIPLTIVGFSSCVFVNSYELRALSMALIGITNVKIISGVVNCQE
jgi:hypothetical protein